VLTIVVFDMPTGELVVKSVIFLPVHPTCAMTVSLRNTPIGTPRQARLGRTPMIDGAVEHEPPGLGRP